MGSLQREHGERHTRFLTSRQRPNQLQTTRRDVVNIHTPRELTVHLPSHAGDLEVAQMLTIFLFSLPGELVRQELDGRHRGDQVVHVMLREVASANCVSRNRTLQSDPWR